MTTTVKNQVLINARALIAERAHWTTGTLACTANGRRVAWHDQSATKWCALGAIYRAAYDLVGDPTEATRIGNEVAKSVSPARWFRGGLPAINDVRGHAAVLKVFDKALQAA
jgi:YD repeat-containing protein